MTRLEEFLYEAEEGMLITLNQKALNRVKALISLAYSAGLGKSHSRKSATIPFPHWLLSHNYMTNSGKSLKLSFVHYTGIAFKERGTYAYDDVKYYKINVEKLMQLLSGYECEKSEVE